MKLKVDGQRLELRFKECIGVTMGKCNKCEFSTYCGRNLDECVLEYGRVKDRARKRRISKQERKKVRRNVERRHD